MYRYDNLCRYICQLGWIIVFSQVLQSIIIIITVFASDLVSRLDSIMSL